MSQFQAKPNESREAQSKPEGLSAWGARSITRCKFVDTDDVLFSLKERNPRRYRSVRRASRWEQAGPAAAALQRLPGPRYCSGLDWHLLDEARHVDQRRDQAVHWVLAYLIPLRAFPLVERFTSQDSAVSTPITEMVVNSLITSHANGTSEKPGYA